MTYHCYLDLMNSIIKTAGNALPVTFHCDFVVLWDDDNPNRSSELIGFRRNAGRDRPRTSIDSHVHLVNPLSNRYRYRPPTATDVAELHGLPICEVASDFH